MILESHDQARLEDMLEGCIRKKDKSRELLYKRFFGYAMGVALLYNHQRDNALEVVNDSFLKVFSKIDQYDRSLPFQGWLRKIVINTSIDYLRRNSKTPLHLEAEKQHIPDETPNIISEMAAADLLKILNLLPYFHKTVFCLYEIEGYSHEEIAGRLGIPTSSSRVYLTRAKAQLRELFPVKNLQQ